MIFSLISNWLYWHFIQSLIEILRGIWNFVIFFFNYFSIPNLIKTLFNPWKKAEWETPKGFNLKLILKIKTFNFISRIIGAILRSFIILLGIIFIILTLAVGIVIIIFWLTSPVLIVLGLIKSFDIIF